MQFSIDNQSHTHSNIQLAKYNNVDIICYTKIENIFIHILKTNITLAHKLNGSSRKSLSNTCELVRNSTTPPGNLCATHVIALAQALQLCVSCDSISSTQLTETEELQDP